MTFTELITEMRKFNIKHQIERRLSEKKTQEGEVILMKAKVVIKNSALFEKTGEETSIVNRTYYFNNYNKAFTTHDIGYSIYAYCAKDGAWDRIENLEDDDIESVEIIEIVE